MQPKILTIAAFLLSLLGVKAQNQVQNSGFNNWIISNTVNIPIGWNTFSQTVSGAGQSVMQTTDAVEGSFALQLNGDTTWNNAWVTYGTKSYTAYEVIFDGKPFTANVKSVKGQYKYLPSSSGFAWITVLLLRNDTVVAHADSTFHFAQNQYTTFSIDFQSTNGLETFPYNPDSIFVEIHSADTDGSSSLYIDDLSFSSGDVGIKEAYLSSATLGIYPNPTSGNSNLKIGLLNPSTVNYEVRNIMNQVVDSKTMGSMKEGSHSISIETSNYPKGIYFVNVIIGDSILSEKLFVN